MRNVRVKRGSDSRRAGVNIKAVYRIAVQAGFFYGRRPKFA
jgi:hypothetical protein